MNVLAIASTKVLVVGRLQKRTFVQKRNVSQFSIYTKMSILSPISLSTSITFIARSDVFAELSLPMKQNEYETANMFYHYMTVEMHLGKSNFGKTLYYYTITPRK